MKRAIFYTPDSENEGIVDRTIHVEENFPTPLPPNCIVTEQPKSTAVEVLNGQQAVEYVNIRTGVTYFKVIGKHVLTREERIERDLKAVQLALDELIFGGMQ